MTREEYCSNLPEVISKFNFQGKYVCYKSYGSGHINDTFIVVFKKDDASDIRYILQRINMNVFKKPEDVMDNIVRVTSFLRSKITNNGGDSERGTLNLVMTKDNKPFYVDSLGSYWRAYDFIESSLCLQSAESESDFYQSAVAFGNFQKMLNEFPAETLHETIPDFHNTPDRFNKFIKAINEDKLGRADSVKIEIEFIEQRKEFTSVLFDNYKRGDLPLRVTHNDTKLNNVMLDSKTRSALCVIDLDTIMPGFSVTDFGDSIRFGASTGAEDETDLSKVNLDLNLFDTYTKGFLVGCGGLLTDSEISLLAEGAKMMTLECGMRFLTDYLEGDTYFKIHYPQHNLDRCRTQLKLVSDMETKWVQMKEIVNKNK